MTLRATRLAINVVSIHRGVSIGTVPPSGTLQAEVFDLVEGVSQPGDDAVQFTAMSNTADTTWVYSLIDDAGGVFQIDSGTGLVTIAPGQVVVAGTYEIQGQAVGNVTGLTLQRLVQVPVRAIEIMGGDATPVVMSMLEGDGDAELLMGDLL